MVGNGHLKLMLAEGPDGGPLEAMAFGAGDRKGEVGAALDLAASLVPNTWNGVTRLELRVKDFAPPSVALGG